MARKGWLRRSVRVLAAAAALAGIASLAAADLAPQTSIGTALMYAALGAFAGMALLVVASVIIATIAQLVLKRGGTDAQWFWFNGEPRGLRQWRSEHGAAAQGFPKVDGGA